MRLPFLIDLPVDVAGCRRCSLTNSQAQAFLAGIWECPSDWCKIQMVLFLESFMGTTLSCWSCHT